MNYLWDTCVLSDLGKPDRNPFVTDYLASIPTHETFISVITLGEIEFGISRLPVGRRRMAIEDVMYEILEEFSTRVLSVSTDIARIWGQLSASTRSKGFDINAADMLIAATALHHGMHVVTRNVKDFEPTGVLLINPWEEVAL